ncbi:hypothetical protein GCM10009801_44480 [Streptomyces albiaxialis]|uniref:Terpene synthase n=2 Tax=Streptomyces albiaxialis TaxID=329523 RepID=A0ABN2W5H6_9ACTN
MNRRADVPDIACPFPFSVNPHAERARAHLRHWTHETGLIRGERARRRFEHADFGWFAALVYPTAPPERLDLLADWFAWLFLVDDQLDDGSFGRSPEQLAEVIGQMREVLDRSPDETAAEPSPSPTPALAPSSRLPVVASLADLWRRTAEGTSARWRARFAGHLAQCLTTAAVWEAGNRLSGRVPPEDEYVANRRHTGAIYVCMDLIEIAESAELPPEIEESAAYLTALDAACDVVCWVNDVYSLAKERALGEFHNLVHIVGHQRGLPDDKALCEVVRAVAGETARYLAAEAELRAAHPAPSRALEGGLAGMRTWMRGNLDWSRRTHRYGADTALPDGYLEPALVEADGLVEADR